jgi:DNA sulfur modification protein DndD
MILRSIVLENFRQFYGEQKITFATDPIKNITLIHSENGVGKTGLLNSILWCLFKKTTPNFRGPTDILNEAAADEGKEKYSVTVCFEHDEKEYSALRVGDNSGQKFRVYEIMPDGNYNEHGAPDYFMNSVIPKEMAEYFFFQGEGKGGISSQIDKGGISVAIRKILGFTLAESAIDDLDAYRKKIQKEAASLSDTNKLTTFLSDQKKIEGYKNSDVERKDKSMVAIAGNKEKIKKIEAMLRETDGATKIQTDKDKLKIKLDLAERDLLTAKAAELSLISQFGAALFGKKMADVSLDFIDESVYTGKIPSHVTERLITDLLAKHSCLCEREVLDGTPEYKALASHLDTSSNPDVIDRIMRARDASNKIKNQCSQADEYFTRASKDVELANSALSKISTSIKECTEKLKNSDIDSVKKNENELEKLVAINDAENVKQGSLAASINNYKDELSSLEKSINRAMMQQPKLKKLQEKTDFVQSLIKNAKTFLIKHEEDSRNSLVLDINKTLDEFSRKNYQVYLDKNFNLSLKNNKGNNVNMSDGEMLLLSLAFISTLISIAETRVNASGSILVSGAVAPFVIDAPFGALDRTYKAATASFLPKQARQIVFLLSSAHWTGEVDEAIEKYVGTEYLLISERDEESSEKPLDKIEIRNKTYEQSVYGAERNQTRIMEINNGID